MRSLRPSLAVPLLALTLAAGSPACASGPAGDPHARISAAVEAAMERHGVPGVGIALVEGYEVTWTASFGEAEPGRAVTGETLFQAASLSKPMAAVAVAALAEEGVVDLDADALAATVSWHHPPPWWEGQVTLRMLLAHRGGVNVSGFPGYALDERLPGLVEILDGVRDKNPRIRVTEEPGERRYSGGGYLIAQLVVEDATGEDFAAVADRTVLGPLGLRLSTFGLLWREDRPRVAVGHREDGSEVAGGGWHQYPETAAGSLWTTPAEYAAFTADVMRSYADGTGVVLDRATAATLLDPGLAAGFGVATGFEGLSIGHEGANEGYRSRVSALPDEGVGVVVLTNSDTGLDLTDEVVPFVYEAMDWPRPGWATPLWMVLAGLGVVAAAGWWVVRLVRRRRRA